MLFSAQVLLFKVLKMMRLQDAIGMKPQQRIMFAVACIAAANQCDKNIQGKPLFFKSLSKATFLAINYAELDPEAYSKPSDYIGLISYNYWNETYYEHLVQMYNGVCQTLDLHLEVVYPIFYLKEAIRHQNRDVCFRKEFLRICR